MSEELTPNIDNQTPLDAVLNSVKDIAVLPQVVFKIMEGTKTTETSAGELEKSIQVDPGFSAKVLSMANSAYFALPRRVTSIKDAVAFLGFKTVRQIAMMAGVFDLFVGKTDAESLRRREWWRHSLDTATCARWIAGHYPTLAQEEAYTAGLLHLIGRTVLDKFDPKLYAQVMAAVEQKVPVLLAEKHFCGCDHVEVTVGVATQWGLPPEISLSLDYHNQPEVLVGPTVQACVAAAHGIAEYALHGVPEGQPLSSLFAPWCLAALGMTENIDQWVVAGQALISQTNSAA